MEKSLYEAAITGNVSQLLGLLEQDPDLLARAQRDCSLKNNPLHIGSWMGHLNFVTEILTRKPELTCELNSHGQSPLHLASAKGHVDVVKELLKVNSEVCFVNDRDGKTPFHAAAEKGRVEVLKEMYRIEPKAAWVLTDEGEPILHVCVNHNQFEALKVLMKLVEDREFVNMKDDDDNTILHILAGKDQYKVIKYLIINNIGVEVNAINVKGWTALDVSRGITTGTNHWKIKGILKSVGAKTARQISPNQSRKNSGKVINEKYQTWLSEMKESLMVVATLMATITYQAGMNPPAGVFQDDGYHNATISDGLESYNVLVPHDAGTAVMAYYSTYKYFTFFNTTGLFASLSLILLLVSGLSFQRKISICGLMIITWIAVASILGSYLCSFYFITPFEELQGVGFWLAVPLSVVIWLLLMVVVLGAHIFRWLRRLFYMLGFSRICQCGTPSICSKICSVAQKKIRRSKRENDSVDESKNDLNP